jgi:hypothetical protein
MTTLEELQGHMDQFMNQRNNRGMTEFEGYSPFEMQYILHVNLQQKAGRLVKLCCKFKELDSFYHMSLIALYNF